MTPEDKADIQAIVCLVEKDLRSQQRKSERKLIAIELAMLPLAITLLILYPIPAAWSVLLPNVVLRAYQVVKGQ